MVIYRFYYSLLFRDALLLPLSLKRSYEGALLLLSIAVDMRQSSWQFYWA